MAQGFPGVVFLPSLVPSTASSFHGEASAVSEAGALGALPVGLGGSRAPFHWCQPGRIYERLAEPGMWCADVSGLARL